MSIVNGNCVKGSPHRFIFNRHNELPFVRYNHTLNHRKIIDIDRIISKEINKNGYYTIIGLTIDSEDMTLYKVTIHNIDDGNNILSSSMDDEIAVFEILYKYEEEQ